MWDINSRPFICRDLCGGYGTDSDVTVLPFIRHVLLWSSLKENSMANGWKNGIRMLRKHSNSRKYELFTNTARVHIRLVRLQRNQLMALFVRCLSRPHPLTSTSYQGATPCSPTPAVAGRPAASAWLPSRPRHSPHVSPSSWAPPGAPCCGSPAAASACPRTPWGVVEAAARAARRGAAAVAESAGSESGAGVGAVFLSEGFAALAPVQALLSADRP